MPRIRVLEIEGKNIDVTRRKLDGDKVKLEKEELEFNSNMLFNIAFKKFKNKISIKRKPCLIHIKGKKTFLAFKDKDEELEGITNTDRKAFTKRVLLQALTKVKPISLSMFLILLGVGVVNIVIMILGFTGRIG